MWINHFRRGDARLASLLDSGQVRCHDFVVGELACGRRRFSGEGLGWIDVHLLAAALIDGLPLWTRDRALHAAAKRLGVGFADE